MTCPGGKRGYLTKRDAKRAINPGIRKLVRHVYLCRCGLWHMTSRRGSRAYSSS